MSAFLDVASYFPRRRHGKGLGGIENPDFKRFMPISSNSIKLISNICHHKGKLMNKGEIFFFSPIIRAHLE